MLSCINKIKKEKEYSFPRAEWFRVFQFDSFVRIPGACLATLKSIAFHVS